MYISKVFSPYWLRTCSAIDTNRSPDIKVHGAKMGPTWVLSAPDGPHVGPMNLAIRVLLTDTSTCICALLVYIFDEALGHLQYIILLQHTYQTSNRVSVNHWWKIFHWQPTNQSKRHIWSHIFYVHLVDVNLAVWGWCYIMTILSPQWKLLQW